MNPVTYKHGSKQKNQQLLLNQAATFIENKQDYKVLIKNNPSLFDYANAKKIYQSAQEKISKCSNIAKKNAAFRTMMTDLSGLAL